MKLDKELCEALVGLRENRNWKIFLECMKTDESEEINRSLQLSGPQCHRAQGAALKCREYLKAFDDAPATLEKFKTQPTKT